MHIVIIGAGLMGGWHAYTAKRLGARIFGVCDSNLENAKQLALRYPGASAFSSIDEALEPESVSVVHICTPLHTHRDLCLTALSRQVHVVCEKPLVGTASEVREIVAQAEKFDRMICPVHQFSAQKGTLLAKQRLEGLGKICRISFTIFSAGAEGLDEQGRNAVVADILPHPFSVLNTLWPAVSLSDLQWNCINATSGEVLGQCRFGTVPVSISISMSARPTRCSMEVQGTNGSFLLDFFHGYCVQYPGKASKFRKMVYPFSDTIRLFSTAAVNLAERTIRRQPAYPGLDRLIDNFYRCLSGQSPAYISSAEAIIDQAVARDKFIEAMEKSAPTDTSS